MNITLTDFGFDDLMALIVIINLFINFITLLFYEVIKDIGKEKNKKN